MEIYVFGIDSYAMTGLARLAFFTSLGEIDMPEAETQTAQTAQPEAPTCERREPSSVYNPAIHGPNFCPDCG
jgi:hypothetical protein